MPPCTTYTSGFFEKSTLFMSTFHVPARLLCAPANPVVRNRAPSGTRNDSFFIVIPPVGSNLRWQIVAVPARPWESLSRSFSLPASQRQRTRRWREPSRRRRRPLIAAPRAEALLRRHRLPALRTRCCQRLAPHKVQQEDAQGRNQESKQRP